MTRKAPSSESVRELNRHLLMLAEELEAKKRRREARGRTESLAFLVVSRCRELAEVRT